MWDWVSFFFNRGFCDSCLRLRAIRWTLFFDLRALDLQFDLVRGLFVKVPWREFFPRVVCFYVINCFWLDKVSSTETCDACLETRGLCSKNQSFVVERWVGPCMPLPEMGFKKNPLSWEEKILFLVGEIFLKREKSICTQHAQKPVLLTFCALDVLFWDFFDDWWGKNV